MCLSIRRRLLAGAFAMALPGLLSAQTTRVSVGLGGAEANGHSYSPAISVDGRWVAFDSDAGNLVPSDTNGRFDVFVRDQMMWTTSRVSVGPAGTQTNDDSRFPAISGDGRWVAFESGASNLVAGDTNGMYDVFVHDRVLGTTTRVSVGPGGSEADRASSSPSISADGRLVAFWSQAGNLVAGDTNGFNDVFVHDRLLGTTTRVSVGPGGTQGNFASHLPAISGDGRWVAFESDADTLVAGDTNHERDVFVHDLQTRTTTRVSVAQGGAQGNSGSRFPDISVTGRWVAFESEASNLLPGDTNAEWDVFVVDRQTGTVTRASVGPGGAQGAGASHDAAVSADGRWVTFQSTADNLVADDTNYSMDVFAYDGLTGTTARVSLGRGVAQANAFSYAPAISADGRLVAFFSVASNLVDGDTNGLLDVFVRDRWTELIPQPPTQLAASVVGNLVTLRWTITTVGPAPREFVLHGGVHPGEVLASIPTGSPAPVFAFAAPSGSFYVRIYAVNGLFWSVPSNEIRIHVNTPLVPSAPANLLGLVNGSTLALAWTNTYAGGAPTSLVLDVRDVTGAFIVSLPLGLTNAFSFDGVPGGTYTLSVRAENAAGSSPSSNQVTLTFPGACSGPPGTPADVFAYRVGQTVFVDWAPGGNGSAPTSYVLNVTGSFVGGFATTGRALSGTVGPGSYTLSVVAVNPCGASAGSPPQTVVVP